MNIVCGNNLIHIFKTSRYFRQNLGLVATIENNGRRELNKKDSFSFYYNNLYRTTIYAQGNIGNIKIYLDYYIKEDVFAVYYGNNFEEFVINYDDKIFKNGMDFYLGHIIKNIEEEYQDRKQKEELKKIEEKPKGDPNRIFNNPGQVSYEDLKAYIQEKKKNIV
jgi:hypothetical protein